MSKQHLKTIVKSAAEPHRHCLEESPSALKVLEELFDLLEDYGPAWYTEALHKRALAVLHTARQSAA